ncbi:hypothetical protein wVul_0586 [Wolbachia endosymbiont of Armadillidium vulgare str. wVulC]|nr:hypothetical protein wVul_0586 [Wolbachia endosymbiont of Armadillidium vulgare str. wVulC]
MLEYSVSNDYEKARFQYWNDILLGMTPYFSKFVKKTGFQCYALE